MYIYPRPFKGDYPLTRGFGECPEAYTQYGLTAHNGSDWGTPELTITTPIYNGIVVKSQLDTSDPVYGGYGEFVKIYHPELRIHTLHAHLNRRYVKVGQSVYGGTTQLGLTGHTGNVYPKGIAGAHIHFEIRPDNEPRDNGYNGAVDPIKWLATHRAGLEMVIPDIQEISLTTLFKVKGLIEGQNIRPKPVAAGDTIRKLSAGEIVNIVDIAGKDAWGLTDTGGYMALHYYGTQYADVVRD